MSMVPDNGRFSDGAATRLASDHRSGAPLGVPNTRPTDQPLEDALVFAARLHRGQRRKGSGIPYVSHLLAVASLVIEHGEDEDQAIAALLHDAIEDFTSELSVATGPEKGSPR